MLTSHLVQKWPESSAASFSSRQTKPAIAKSPRQWFRMRDTDALIRYTIGAALACNDLDDVWYTEKQFEMLDELGATLYDGVAFFKHRSEGETVRPTCIPSPCVMCTNTLYRTLLLHTCLPISASKLSTSAASFSGPLMWPGPESRSILS
jgi:hypothetical protein